MNQRTSQAGSSSCQCSTTLYGMQKEVTNYVKINQRQFKEYAERFPRGHWSFLGPGSEKKWYGTYDGNQMDLGIELRRKCCRISKFPVIRYSDRGQFRSKVGGKTTSHFNESTENRVDPPDFHLRQSAQSLRSSSGYDCRITSWSESSRETRCIRSAG